MITRFKVLIKCIKHFLKILFVISIFLVCYILVYIKSFEDFLFLLLIGGIPVLLLICMLSEYVGNKFKFRLLQFIKIKKECYNCMHYNNGIYFYCNKDNLRQKTEEKNILE
jgi:hypothetical protein